MTKCSDAQPCYYAGRYKCRHCIIGGTGMSVCYFLYHTPFNLQHDNNYLTCHSDINQPLCSAAATARWNQHKWHMSILVPLFTQCWHPT